MLNKNNIQYCPDYFYRYMNLTEDLDYLTVLQKSLSDLQQAPLDMWEKIGDQTYAPEKWTVKQILQHLIDTERIFTYRALAFARQDKEIIPPFDENDYAQQADVSHRTIQDLWKEFIVVRQSLIALFQSFTEAMLLQTGTMISGKTQVIAFPYIFAGHQYWHFKIIEERYFPLVKTK